MKKILVTVAAVALVLTACSEDPGSSSDDAKGTLVDSLEALLEADALTQTISIQSDTDSLVALGEGDIDEETADKILDSSVTASAVQAENPEDASSQVVLNLAGNDALEIRFVAGDLYVRADVAGILETFGQDPAQLDALTSQVEGRQGFEWVGPAVAGEWIVIRDALALMQQFGGGAAALNGDQQKQVVDDLLQTIRQNATVTSEGEDDAGDHLQAALPLRDTLRDLIDVLGPAASAAGAGNIEDSLQDIPNEDIVLDFWVADGRVSQLAVDILQFEELAAESGEEFPEGLEELAIVVRIDEFDGDIDAVADAVEIDTAALGQAVTGLMTGGTGLGGTGAAPGEEFDCDLLKGSPPEVIELYAKECPELQK